MATFIATNVELKTINKPGSVNNGHEYFSLQLIRPVDDQAQAVTYFIWIRGNQWIKDKYMAMFKPDTRRFIDPETGRDYVFKGTKVRVESPVPFFKRNVQTRVNRHGKVLTEGDYVRDGNGDPKLFTSQRVFCRQIVDEDTGNVEFADGCDPETVFDVMFQQIFTPAIEVAHPLKPGETKWVTPEEARILNGTSPVVPTQESAGQTPPVQQTTPPVFDQFGNVVPPQA